MEATQVPIDRWTDILYDFTFTLNRKNKTNEQTKLNRNRVTDTEKKQLPEKRGLEGGKK